MIFEKNYREINNKIRQYQDCNENRTISALRSE